MVTLGWRASSRTSSAPTYPVAPDDRDLDRVAVERAQPVRGRRAGRGEESRGRSAAIAAPAESALTGAREPLTGGRLEGSENGRHVISS